MEDEVLLDALDVQAWKADASGLLTFVNAFTEGYFGRSREQLVGEGWQNMLHSADLPRAVETWTNALRSGEAYCVEFRLLRGSDRAYRWHRASARLVPTPAGLTWFGINVDVDAQRRADEVLNAYRAKAASTAPGK